MIGWLQGEMGPTTKSFLEEVSREFRGFVEGNQQSLIFFLLLVGLVLIAIGIKRVLAPRAQRLRDIQELFERLAEANRLAAEERGRLEAASTAAQIENPAHLFARVTVYDAAVRAVLASRPAERERLASQYEQLKVKLFS